MPSKRKQILNKLNSFDTDFFNNVFDASAFANFDVSFNVSCKLNQNENGLNLIFTFQAENIPLFDIDMYGNLSLYHTLFNVKQFNVIQKSVEYIKNANLPTLINDLD